MPSPVINRRVLLGSSGGGSAFSPLNLSSLVEWWDVASLSALADNDPVASWVGMKAGITAVAAGAARPLYDADAGDGNGACVTPDGTDDELTVNIAADNLTYFPNTSLEVWAVCYHPTAIPSGVFVPVIGVGGVDSAIGTWLTFSDNNIYFDTPSTALGRISTAPPGWRDAWHVVRLAKHGDTRLIEMDGSALFSDTKSGNLTTGTSTTFAPFTAGTGLKLRHLLLFNDAVAGDDLAALKTYLFDGYSFGP